MSRVHSVLCTFDSIRLWFPWIYSNSYLFSLLYSVHISSIIIIYILRIYNYCYKLHRWLCKCSCTANKLLAPLSGFSSPLWPRGPLGPESLFFPFSNLTMKGPLDKNMVSQDVAIDATDQDDWDMQRLGKTQQFKVSCISHIPRPPETTLKTDQQWSTIEKFPFLLHLRFHYDIDGHMGVDSAVSWHARDYQRTPGIMENDAARVPTVWLMADELAWSMCISDRLWDSSPPWSPWPRSPPCKFNPTCLSCRAWRLT